MRRIWRIAAALCGMALLAACVAARRVPEENEPPEPQPTAVRPRPIPEPAEPMKPLDPGIYVLDLSLGQVPVLVAEEENPALDRINSDIVEFALGSGPDTLRSYTFEYDCYMQAVMVDLSGRVNSFTYDTRTQSPVSPAKAMEEWQVDLSALYPRCEEKLAETGRSMTGLRAEGFRYLEGAAGIELYLRASWNDGEPGSSLWRYRSDSGILREDPTGERLVLAATQS